MDNEPNERKSPSNPPGSSQDAQGDVSGPNPRQPGRKGEVDRRAHAGGPGSSGFNRRVIAEGTLEAALLLSGAPRGNVQLMDESGALWIVAQRGFKAPFLDFFQPVRGGQGASCGAAAESATPVIVEDVSRSPLFVGTPALEVMIAARALAVASLPIRGRSDELMGVLSVHYETPQRPSARNLSMLRTLVSRTGKRL